MEKTFSLMLLLPVELIGRIIDEVAIARGEAVLLRPRRRRLRINHEIMKASTPPADGSSPFMRLPAEIHRQIFAYSIPSRFDVHAPVCNDDQKLCKTTVTYLLMTPRRNHISNLMTLNKRICGEVTEMVYEERMFVIHVHEGLRDGGIEFQDTGRQPLHYQSDVKDGRFQKFGIDDQFGFRRLKKIRIEIYPAHNETHRHLAINTYFINLALCRLLEREQAQRITKLEIKFAKSKCGNDQTGSGVTQRFEQYWFDPNSQAPRQSSVHNLPDIQLVLLPFAMLTGCHKVSIELPENVRTHFSTVRYVSDLEKSMMSHSNTVWDDDMEMKIERARQAMEDYIYNTIHGGRRNEDISKLSEEEMQLDEDYRLALEAQFGDDEPSPTNIDVKKRKLDEWHNTVMDQNKSGYLDMDADLQAAIAASMGNSTQWSQRQSKRLSGNEYDFPITRRKAAFSSGSVMSQNASSSPGSKTVAAKGSSEIDLIDLTDD